MALSAPLSRSGSPAASPDGLNAMDRLESLSYTSHPRPFKALASSSTAAGSKQRNRTLKQIVTTEREQVLGLVTSGKRKGKKPLTGKAAEDASKREKEKDMFGKGKLQGAAARSLKKRLEREYKERVRARENGEAEGEAEGEESRSVEPEGGTETDDVNTREDTATTSAALSPSETPAPLDEEAAAAEALLKRRRELPSYFTVEAPPSLRPRKKYCDVTGLIAPYTDPKSQLRYHNVEIYEAIRAFGPGVDQAYLSLRGDGTALK